MNKAINIPDNLEGGTNEESCDRPLTKELEAEKRFNLVNFVETLIAMDRQKQEWDKQKQSKKIS
jgi:hypothetical protein